MEQIALVNINGTRDLFNVYHCSEFPFNELNHELITKSKKKTKKQLYKLPMTFDIETTSMFDKEQHCYGFMYIWQACVMGILVFGRTWSEWQEFLHHLCNNLELSKDKQLVCYIHNASFEFQFMRQFIQLDSVFATDKRKVLKFTDSRGIEFRCSYRLTNMSLAKACENEMGVQHVKALADLDYNKVRTPKTRLTRLEMGYCMSDVLSLYEMVLCRMKNHNDDLFSIPMTSTGYVRREVKKEVLKSFSYKKLVKDLSLDLFTYNMIKLAQRGGNTHANLWYSGRIIQCVDSFDVVSSYPTQMILGEEYPISKYVEYGTFQYKEDFAYMRKKYSCLFIIKLRNVCIKMGYVMPYIAKDKCIGEPVNANIDNGRILMCDSCVLCMNEIDFRIIEKQYDFEYDIEDVKELRYALKGPLPKELRNKVLQFFKDKCELKDKIKHETDAEKLANYKYMYAQSKAYLNSIFGMCMTDIIHDEVIFNINEHDEKKCAMCKHKAKCKREKWCIYESDAERVTKLEKHNNSYGTFLAYQWGYIITSLAREWLETLLDICGPNNAIYCDTDSCKCIHDDAIIAKINEENAKIMQICELKGAYCDVNGKRYYLGIYEKENDEPLNKFITLGAKKYAYVEDGKLHATISGVNKKCGAKELGKIENFKIGFTFIDSASKEVTYNDVKPTIIKVKGCEIVTGANIGLSESTYTLGITDTYAELIDINMEEFI